MRRTPATLLLVLFAFVLAPATAYAVDGDGEITFEVPLRTDNDITAKLEADEDEIELTFSRGAQQAIYFAEGEVSRDGIAVKFGGLGEFVVDYEPFRTLERRRPYRECTGEPRTKTEGFFRGTLRFRGEDDYVSVEATSVKGTLVLQPPWRCPYGPAGASRALRPEAERSDVTLSAASRRDPVGFQVISSRDGGEGPFSYFFALSSERRKAIGISRYTAAGYRHAFEFDNLRGTAFVDPPAPFAGSARYVRRPHARDRWTGSLTAPLLGLGRVRLAGPGFVAKMVPELPAFR